MRKRNSGNYQNKYLRALKELFSNRLVVLGTIIMVLLLALVYRLFVLQIVEGEEHLANFNYKVEKTIEIGGSRGNIYDCNGKLLAYNQLAYSVTFENSDALTRMVSARKKKDPKITENAVKNEVLYKLIHILERNGDQINYNLPIVMNSKGKPEFSTSGTALTRFKKDIYGIVRYDELTGDNKAKADKWLNTTAEQVYEYLRMGTDGPTGSGYMFNISDEYSMEDTLKIMSIRYDAYMNRYSQTTPITVASNISEKSIAAVMEGASELPGVNVATDSLRKYNQSIYFSGIIGYTGIISEEEMETYNEETEEDMKYSSSDTVGKTGIEKTMESTLRGKKGEQKVLVNNLGKIIKVVDTTESEAGKDIYLTIDADLQIYAYNILERRLAGIVLAHLTTADSAGSDKMIPIKNVYSALFENNVIDIGHIASGKAKSVEKQVYDLFKTKQNSVLNRLKNILKNGTTPYNSLGEERKAYVDHIVTMLKDNEVLVSARIDEDDQVYKDWTKGRVSLRKYLQYAMNKEWIDINAFDIESDYYEGDEIYDELVSYITANLKQDEEFDKLLYKYMIKTGNLSGKKVCMLLYDQNVLKRKSDKDYTALKCDEISAYTFMQNKIRNLDITPAQLALDPCSGSIVITDPDNGDVLAMVSYPSYDNNKLANGIDADYFAKLNNDKSSPMLNRATQTRTAPGSTFKPISSTAVLEEGIVDAGDVVKCTGLYDKVSPPAKCWIYPSGAHGKLNVAGAIANSCNYFFYEMAYRLGTKNGEYNSALGLKKLTKYAERYGLDRKSGVEIAEYEPHISDTDAVRTAIGQATNSFTPSQIARYFTSLTNGDKLLNLTLLDKCTDVDGNVIRKYKNKSAGKLNVSDDIFTQIRLGLKNVVYGKKSSIKYLFAKKGLKVAGKTGTAEENKKRANHALFVSCAPYDDPEVCMTVVIPNGYTSRNAAEVARDMYQYYLKHKKISGTRALMPSGSDSNSD